MESGKMDDRAEAIDILTRMSTNHFYGHREQEAFKLAAEALKQWWIPVTERLPDINDHYNSDVCLVYCDNGVYTFAVLKENIFGQVGWICEGEDDYPGAVGTVVAWMPLPEYKGGEE
jgi:hypothetical protein